MHKYSAGFTITVSIIVIIYVLAGAVSLAQMHYQERFHLLWVFLGGFWLFLGVGLWRMGHVARGITLLHLWVVVLGAIFLVVQPRYFPNLAMGIVLPDMTKHPAFLIIPVVLAVIAMGVLAKHKEEFQ